MHRWTAWTGTCTVTFALFGCAPVPQQPQYPQRPPGPTPQTLYSTPPVGKSDAEHNEDYAYCQRAAGLTQGFNSQVIDCMRYQGNTERLVWSDGSDVTWGPTRIWQPPPLVVQQVPQLPNQPSVASAPSTSAAPPAIPPAAPPPLVARKPSSNALTPADRKAIVDFLKTYPVAYLTCKAAKSGSMKTCMTIRVGSAMIEDVGPVFCAHPQVAARVLTAPQMESAVALLGCEPGTLEGLQEVNYQR